MSVGTPGKRAVEEVELSPPALRVQAALGARFHVREFSESAHTAQQAAELLACPVGAIAKSIIFRGRPAQAHPAGHPAGHPQAHPYRTRDSQEEIPVLVVASGAQRVDRDKVSDLLGFPVRSAGADFVYAQTGYAVGGVPPVAHHRPAGHLPDHRLDNRPVTVLDAHLRQYDKIWAAAGTPGALFALTPDDLCALTGGSYADIACAQEKGTS